MADPEPVATRTATGGSLREWVTVYLKGFAMGTADAVPGVSGGTIALITGIYERLVDALAAFEVGLLVDFLRVHDAAARRRAVDGFLDMDAPFLVVLGLGAVSGAITLANAVEFGLETYRALTFAFFFGLILASPVVLRDEVDLGTPGRVAVGVAGFAFAFLVSGVQGSLPGGPVVLFVVGAVVICAMVLPGVSGSLVLLAIGKYHVMTGAVSDLTSGVGALAGDGTVADLVAPLSTLGVFAGGAVVGILSFARVVSWALDTYRAATMTFLVGLLVGALRRPAVEVLQHGPPFTAGRVGVLVAAAAVGGGVVLVLEYATGGVQY